MYDPDGDQEETLPDMHGELSSQGDGDGDGGGNGDEDAAGLSHASPAARREELEAMAAAAAPGGLAARPRHSAAGGGGGGVAPLDHPLQADERGGHRDAGGGGGGAAGEGGLAGFPGRPDAEDGAVGAAGSAFGGRGAADVGVDAVAAPAADGWGLAGRGESGGAGGGDPVDGDEGGGRGGGGRRRGRRYFGLLSRDEWISASSSRIEKLNSRAPRKNSWTEEAPINDMDDPYQTEDGIHLVFAVPRAPVDGAPFLVSDDLRVSGWRENEPWERVGFVRVPGICWSCCFRSGLGKLVFDGALWVCCCFWWQVLLAAGARVDDAAVLASLRVCVCCCVLSVQWAFVLAAMCIVSCCVLIGGYAGRSRICFRRDNAGSK